MAGTGEGSRGGKIIGHYKSGRAKYEAEGAVAVGAVAHAIGSSMRSQGQRKITKAMSQAGELAASSMNHAKGNGELARAIAAVSGRGPGLKKLAQAGIQQKAFGTKLAIGGLAIVAAGAYSIASRKHAKKGT